MIQPIKTFEILFSRTHANLRGHDMDMDGCSPDTIVYVHDLRVRCDT